MAWPHYRETVTVFDVLESGACWEGVTGFVVGHRRQIAGPTREYVDTPEVLAAAHGSGDGSGSGDGYGDGDGDGDGYGYGSGYGYGYGDGSGDGDGSE